MLTQERKRQKQLLRGVLKKRCSENTQQTHRRIPTPKRYVISIKLPCNSIEIIPWQGCPLQIHCILSGHAPTPTPSATSPKNTSGWLLLKREKYQKVYIKNFILKFMKIYQNETLFIYSSRLSTPKTFSISVG